MKTMYELAIEVLDGKWGSGDARKNALTKAGYDYEAVQKKVNEIVDLHNAICDAAKAQVAWSKDSVYKWQSKPTIVKSKTHGTCVTYVACVLQRIGVLKSGEYVWTNGTGFGNGKVLGANDRMIVTYYNNKKSVKDLKKILQVGDVLIFDDNKSGKVGDCGHICIYNGHTYYNGIRTFTGGHNISVNGKEKYTRKVLAIVRIKSMPKRKTVDELAHEVLDGKWGSGDKRKDNLINAGYDYDKVQARVNELAETKKTYGGEFPSLKITKTNAEVIADTILWIKWIAGNNSFHYGHGKEAHHNGCFFCGTQPSSKKKAGIVDYERTYCCNPLVGAAWAHGGCVPQALDLCRKGKSWNFEKGSGYDKSSLFDNLGKPDMSKLKKGDVLCSDTHVAQYIGDGKIAEAGHEDDNKKNSKSWNTSIRVTELTSLRYNKFKRIHRFNRSTVSMTVYIGFGEISDRVAQLQDYLKWYGCDIASDRYFGEATLKAVKQFQSENELVVDGKVGTNTLKKMQEVKR